MNTEQIEKEIEKFESKSAQMSRGSAGENAMIQIELVKAVWEVARQLSLRETKGKR